MASDKGGDQSGADSCRSGLSRVTTPRDIYFDGMMTSQRYMESKPATRFADMEWQTPAVSEKFQSRFSRRPGTADSGDTGLGTSASDSTEGDHFCMERCLNLGYFCNKVPVYV
uniref:Uncharacterized protein n=1 Tax=Tetraodon nigroviridis TaxID=99883 RepID=H3C182_TETNG